MAIDWAKVQRMLNADTLANVAEVARLGHPGAGEDSGYPEAIIASAIDAEVAERLRGERALAAHDAKRAAENGKAAALATDPPAQSCKCRTHPTIDEDQT